MDAIRLVKQDHRRVEALFEQFQTLVGLPGEGRTRLIQEICRELMMHSTAEEQFVYPAMRRQLDDGQTKAGHAEAEHAEVDELIEQIRSCDPTTAEIETLMAQLKSKVMHHVAEEESTLLPQLEAAMPGDALDNLGRQFDEAKQQIMFAGADAKVAATSTDTREPAMSSGSRGGKTELLDLTKEELYTKAQQAGIEGRSKMTKAELADALSRS